MECEFIRTKNIFGCIKNSVILLWSGFGYADLENRVHCTGDTLMRIASISKPITMAVVAKLWEQGKLDLDKSVNDYVLTWPEKTFKGQKVEILLMLPA